MSSTARLLRAVGAAALAVALGAPATAQQSKSQQACINAINKDAAKVGKAQGKENVACVKLGLKEPPDPICPSADLKQKVAKKIAKALEDDTARCQAGPPDFAYTSGGTASVAYQQAELDLLADVFGSTDLSATISTDKAIGGCQVAVIKDVERISGAAAKAFVKCKKGAIKGAAVAVGDITACVGDDADTKVDGATTKLGADITARCTGVTVSTAFPGLCSGSTTDMLAACLGARARCRMCLAANGADGLSAPCDTIDDGAGNATCGP
jgi:hypothetical protein